MTIAAASEASLSSCWRKRRRWATATASRRSTAQTRVSAAFADSLSWDSCSVVAVAVAAAVDTPGMTERRLEPCLGSCPDWRWDFESRIVHRRLDPKLRITTRTFD